MYQGKTVSSVFDFSVRVVLFSMLVLSGVHATKASNIPIASTVALSGVVPTQEGVVIIANEETEQYMVSESAADPRVYGVTAAQPPVVFSTGTNTVPVITEGVALVQVVSENGAIERGDLLVTSATMGAAMRAGEEDRDVFAVALEAYDDSGEIGRIQADVGIAKALAERSAREAAQEAAVSEGDEETEGKSSVFRGVIAAVLVIGALFFVLYSFRSAIIQGVTSVGRNPRARVPIMTLSVASIVFALLLCALIIFIAVAILILPL